MTNLFNYNTKSSPSKFQMALRRSTRLVSAAALSAVVAASATHAQEVTLRAKDGSSDITAELRSFDGSRYVLESAIGVIQIDAAQVDCIAGACPTIASDSGALQIAGNAYVMNSLMPSLLSDYATGLGGDVTLSPDATTVSVKSPSGNTLGDVDLKSGNTNNSVGNLLNREALLAVTDRPITEDEARSFAQSGQSNPTEDDREVVVALDGLVIIAAPQNPVNALSEVNIARIFAGSITNWSQLGGPNAPISIYTPDAGSAISDNFNGSVMEPNRLAMASSVTRLGSDEEVSRAVTQDPFGIGFVNFSGKAEAKALSILGACGIQTPPTAFTLKTEEYPFTRRLLMYRSTDELPVLATSFINYLETQDAQNVISNNRFVNKSVSLIDSDAQGRRYASAMWPTDAETSLRELGAMVKELLPAQRVSLTFRFLPGSTNLESRGLEDLQRLADLLAAGEVFANKEMLLVGFTDSAGKASANRFLSQKRAERVREILNQIALPGSLDTTPIRTLGFGEVSPLACNETETGKSTNRRVEVWVRDILKS